MVATLPASQPNKMMGGQEVVARWTGWSKKEARPRFAPQRQSAAEMIAHLCYRFDQVDAIEF
eukprot:585761-Pyramimonas_sp.AAC.1